MRNWPRLAWLAKCSRRQSVVEVLHGPAVETHGQWFCEAVWDGSYAEGAFDQTDIVAGSGARARDSAVFFVSSGSTLDRLQCATTEDGGAWVSNSLPCLLNSLSAELDRSYPRYHQDLSSIARGLAEYRPLLPTSNGPVTFQYFHNLRWCGETLAPVPKPSWRRNFSSFRHYREFLESSLAKVATNARDDERQHPFELLGTLSSGYDSPTVTSLARDVGCTEALTFDRARGAHEERGDAIARVLGVGVHKVPSAAWRSMDHPEVPFIATDGRGEDVYLCGANSKLRGRVLLTGYHGDTMWGKEPVDVGEHLMRGDVSGLSISEYRLSAGFINCPIAFWGARQVRDVAAISNSSDMRGWDVAGKYSRPICRRIVEDAGVPRELFGTDKRMQSVLLIESQEFLTDKSLDDYIAWLRQHRREWIQRRRLPPVLSRRLDRALWAAVRYPEALAGTVLRERPSTLRGALRAWRSAARHGRYQRFTGMYYTAAFFRRYLFPWAVETASRRYEVPR